MYANAISEIRCYGGAAVLGPDMQFKQIVFQQTRRIVLNDVLMRNLVSDGYENWIRLIGKQVVYSVLSANIIAFQKPADPRLLDVVTASLSGHGPQQKTQFQA